MCTADSNLPRKPPSLKEAQDGRHAALTASARPCRALAAGFSLVEVMVAMVIGLLGIVVMMQTFSVFEGQKRTTTGGDDAISSGAIALYGVTREIQQSGWGITVPQLIGCNVSGLLVAGAGPSLPMVPIRINPAGIPAGDPNTDVLLVVSGKGNGAVEGDNIDAQVIANAYAVHTPSAFAITERVVAVPLTRPSPCDLASTAVTGVVGPNVFVTVSVAGMTAGRLYNLGASPKAWVYAVRRGNLTLCDYMANDCATDVDGLTDAELAALWVPLASNVVSLRAEYGRDTNADGMDPVAHNWVWDQTVATPTTDPPVSTNATRNTEACGLLRISAVRLAMVARSAQPEKASGDQRDVHVTLVAPEWSGSNLVARGANATEAARVAISLPDVEPDWPTWQDFRYKVFETIVPLRNVTSMGVVEGC